MTHILHIDSSARLQGSVTRTASAETVADLKSRTPNTTVTYRDLAKGEPIISQTWVGATFTPKPDRSAVQKNELSHSDTLVAELKAADIIVIGLPVYNFSVPASLKTWLDQVARVGETFHYTENGPKGLLEGKKVIVQYSSGGTPLGSAIDFATPYLRHMLGFMGLSDVEFETSTPQSIAA